MTQFNRKQLQLLKRTLASYRIAGVLSLEDRNELKQMEGLVDEMLTKTPVVNSPTVNFDTTVPDMVMLGEVIDVGKFLVKVDEIKRHEELPNGMWRIVGSGSIEG